MATHIRLSSQGIIFTTVKGELNIMLEVKGIDLTFGGNKVLQHISFELSGEPKIFAIIGPNGAGKSSLLNCINGYYPTQQGEIIFNGERITKMRPDRIAKLGIARTFQNIELYDGLTALENLMAARYIHMKHSFLEGAIYFGRARKEEVEHRKIVEEIIDFLEMQSIRKELVRSLSYGQRKKVELGRALAMEPKLLLLDEPMAGMNVEAKEDIARFIIDIVEGKSICVILVEHDMGVVMDIADEIMVLNFGEKIASGTTDEIKNNPLVVAAYLGHSGVA